MEKHIFLVDDEMLLNMALSSFLEQNGYKTTMYTSGEACLEALSKDVQPDIILMDINFGSERLNGPETTVVISQKYDIPVVLHSAYTDKETLDSTKEMTKYGYIRKVPGNEHFVLANIEMALKLHSSRKLYRELFHNSNDAIFLHSVTEDGMPGPFFEVNDVACSYLGYDRDELLKMSPGDIDVRFHTDEIADIMKELSEKKRTTFEVDHKTKAGEIVPVEISAHQFSLNNQQIIISSARNTSARKQFEKKLRESEELHRTILGSISDTVFLTDEEGTFLYICPNVDVIFGYHETEVSSFGNIATLLGGVLAATEDLDKRGELTNIERLVTDKAGTEHAVLVNVKRVSIKGATRLYTCRDISELKQKEEELLRSERMYRELSNHLQNVREEQNAYFAREIHDDLGQSLTALKMNLTMIENTSETDTINETTEDMKQILDGIVQKVRALTRELRPPVLDTMGIVEAIKWHITEFEKQFNIPVHLQCEIDEVAIGKEKSLMVFRIIQETLTNSVRHGSPSEISVFMRYSKGELAITVEDNGKGFSSADLQQKSSYGLLGMKERAKQNGGKLDIKSKPGRGTRTNLSIPL